MKGRQYGTKTLSLEDINIIVEMTKAGASRPDIAVSIDKCEKTVYNYQKRLDL